MPKFEKQMTSDSAACQAYVIEACVICAVPFICDAASIPLKYIGAQINYEAIKFLSPPKKN